jgi:predicted RNA-binding protein with PUA-like domain
LSEPETVYQNGEENKERCCSDAALSAYKRVMSSQAFLRRPVTQPLAARPGFSKRRRYNRFTTVKQYWLVKQEPSAYSWTDFVRDGKTAWTGVRNFTARNNLRAMSKGDDAFFYHSVTEKAVVGIAKVLREAYPDPTVKEGDWSAVDLVPEKPLAKPVTLEQIKQNAKLKDMALLRLSRLSVQPLSKAQFDEIVRMSKA